MRGIRDGMQRLGPKREEVIDGRGGERWEFRNSRAKTHAAGMHHARGRACMSCSGFVHGREYFSCIEAPPPRRNRTAPTVAAVAWRLLHCPMGHPRLVIHRNTTMKLLTLPALVVLSLSMAACDRRDAEPVEPASTADTAAVDTPAATMPTDTTTATPPATTAGACEGLTGQALTDCLNQAGPTSTPPAATDPAMTDPTAPPPPTTNDAGTPTDTDVPQPENTDATTPPQS